MGKIVVIKGAGDLASGVALRLFRSGFSVVVLEIPEPTVIRRTVAFAEAVYSGTCIVEGVSGVLAESVIEAKKILNQEKIAVLIDPHWKFIQELQPIAVIDAIIAKRNLGTSKAEADVVIGLGPGFDAGKDVHAVVETQRGHDLGRVIFEGSAIPNTGEPGLIGGYSIERVLRSPAGGIFEGLKDIGDYVNKGDLVAKVGDTPVYATISGILRGILRSGLEVTEGFKIGDIDPRDVGEHCFTVSDKARSIGGGVLEALMHLLKKGGYSWTTN